VSEQLASYRFHPAVLDACFHAFLGLAPAASGGAGDSGLYLPRAIRRIQLHAPADSRRLTAFARRVSQEGTSLLADIRVTGPDGAPVADILGFRLERVDAKGGDDLHDCCYQFRWEPRHLRGSNAVGPCGFAPTAAIVDAVRAAAPALRRRYPLDDYHRCSALQQDVVCRLVLNAFSDLGWRPRRGERFELAPFARRLGIADEHRRVTRVLLRDLEMHGWLRAAGQDAWEVLRVPRRVDAAAALDELAAARPTVAVDVAFGRRTGLRLAAVLSGEADAMELLFPGGSAEHVERFYAEGAAFPAHLEALRVALATALAGLPAARAVRVLEVGGGTGTLTRTVLPELPRDRTEYRFTDISPHFISAARQRLAEVPFVDFQLFDLERDPQGQGLADRSFDLILASNVLHATADIRQTLAHLRRCLAPGGLLMFMELVSRELSLGTITFGLLEGWWRASDLDLRPESPLLDRSQWMRLLAEAGFEGVDAVSCTEEPQQAEHATFLAFRPTEAVSTGTVSPAALPRRYLLFADRRGVAAALHRKLEALGHRSLLVPTGETVSEETLRCLLETGDEPADLAGVVHCCSLDRPDAGGMTLDELRDAQATGLMSVLRVVQAVSDDATPVWVLTRNVQRVASCDLVEGLASAPLTGLVRVANTELQCRFRLVDLDDGPADRAADHVLSEITLPADGELETAYRDGVRHVLRFAAAPPEASPKRTFDAARPDGTVVPYRLQTDKPGILANLALHETGRDTPGPGQVEVRVCAGGLNFRDVMKALGTYPGDPVDLRWLGDDFAGVVERVGQGVAGCRAGDRVAGIAPYAFRSHAVTDARLVFALPDAMSLEEGATLPTAFLTAHYALDHLARLQPGERVLIHAAAGGVGQAALQVARRLSLEVYATAGTPEKRELLRRMGVPHVMSSRSLAFADEILAATEGRGVDAVLNSLAGDFVPKSLSVLAPFGRFLEIGKVDVYRNAKIGLQALRHNASYFVVDLAQHFLERRDSVGEMLRELAALFATGELRPLPFTTFPIGEAALAFRHMGQGKHVGKNVLTFASAGVRVAFRDEPGHRFRPDATYLVTGGAGGFGLEVAKWIAREGGRHLVLMSRSGPRDAAASASIHELRAAGVEVVDARGDVGRREDVKRVLEQLRRDQPPLKGVFHAAVHMDDEFVTRQDQDRVRRVLEPKMQGAWNLHLETLAEGLEHFLCFSSFSTVIAIPKQASYNAGNAFLDQLAQYRRARGLPALSVNFGPLLGAGFVERQGRDGEALAKLGFDAFRIEEALRLLERLLFVESANVAAGRIDWELLVRLSPFVAASRTYRSLVGAARDAGPRGSLRARLAAAAGPDRGRLVEQFIASQVAAVFGTAEERIDRSAPLTALGLDSLMVLELTNRVEREAGVRLPMASLLVGPTIAELGATLVRLLAPTLPASGTPELEVSPAASSRHVVLLRAGGGDPPLFAFHPAGGGVGIYAGLAPHLPAATALYGVESRLKLGEEREYPGIEQMVACYAAEVRATQGGPYRLFGHSLGGYLAARVAESLERDGETVQFVGVMDWDTGQKATPEAQRDGLLRLAVAAYFFAQQESGIVRAVPEARLRADLAGLVDTILQDPTAGSDVFYRWVVDQELVAAPALEGVAREQLNRVEQHCRLLARELPLPRFSAPLCVWRARLGFGSPLEAWRHLGGQSREHVFDGDHNALVRPAGLRVVAGQLLEFLDEVLDARLEAPVGGPLSA
jgi:NADPH:quinone reductase-like Zn-dependent oxidoreductase/thioesterase domain-containing protein/SAM-dependent methyltransferase/acyl carrier protein